MSQSQAVNPVGCPAFRLRATVRALRNTSGITTALPRLSTTPPSWSAGSEAASRLKSRWLVAPSAAPSAVGGWCVMSAPTVACTVTGIPRAAAASGTRQLVGHVAQVPRGEDVGERAPEGGETLVAAGRMREEGRVDFVGALSDGDGLEAREVRLAILGHGCPAGGSEYSLSFIVTWPKENVDCSASITRRSSSESHIRAS